MSESSVVKSTPSCSNSRERSLKRRQNEKTDRLRDEEAAGIDVQEWDEAETVGGDFPPEEPAEPEQEEEINWSPTGVELPRRPLGRNGKPQKRTLAKPDEFWQAFSPYERQLILDTCQRSGLPAGDVAPLVDLQALPVEETVQPAWPRPGWRSSRTARHPDRDAQGAYIPTGAVSASAAGTSAAGGATAASVQCASTVTGQMPLFVATG